MAEAHRVRLAHHGWWIAVVAGVSIATVARADWQLPWQGTPSLEQIERRVHSRYPDVTQLSANELQRLRAAGDRIALLDVRESPEFEVSHLRGAVRIDPSANPDEVLRSLGPRIRGATVVLYCSVGERSSRLAERVQPALRAAGAAQVANLSGGLFGWFVQRLPMVDARGATWAIHGYDAHWSDLLRERRGHVVLDP